jgi:hypothetical protein
MFKNLPVLKENNQGKMNILNKDKFDVIIQKLLDKKLTCETIINHLNENRFKYLNNIENNNRLQKSVFDEVVLSDLNLNQVHLKNVFFL